MLTTTDNNQLIGNYVIAAIGVMLVVNFCLKPLTSVVKTSFFS
jgi:hypothetical protein